MPCQHKLEELEEYLTGDLDGAGLRDDPRGPLFRTIGRGTGSLTRTVLPQANASAMIRRRASSAGIKTKLGNHSFHATGITAYLKNGGTLKKAAAMANHASRRTTQLYYRRQQDQPGLIVRVSFAATGAASSTSADRVAPRGRFDQLDTLDAVLARLFGSIP